MRRRKRRRPEVTEGLSESPVILFMKKQKAKKKANNHGNVLERFSRVVTTWSGGSWAFTIALGVVIVWAATGPVFHYSDTWQLVINTGTTIVTFLMVFLIQRAQNKDAEAIQLKLNEILAAMKGASDRLINVEDFSEDEIRELHDHYDRLAKRARREGDFGAV